MKGRIEVFKERCKGCELCISTCPSGALALSSDFNSSGYYTCTLAHPEKCTGCGLCAVMCPDLAIEVFKEVEEGKSK
jgi:2-oxoglutarate ferredoxin oxidoreductase subunit delta